MKIFYIILICLISSFSYGDKIIYELETGNISNYETDYAETVTLENAITIIDGSYNSYQPNWTNYGFGYVSNLYVNGNTNLGIITNINEAEYFSKIYKLTDEEFQNSKSTTLKIYENKFLNYCDILSGTTNHTKLSFDELMPLLVSIRRVDIATTIYGDLLQIDSACKREGGILWWDDCSYHEDIPSYYCSVVPAAEAAALDQLTKALSLESQCAHWSMNELFMGNICRDYSICFLNDGMAYNCDTIEGLFGDAYNFNNSSNYVFIINNLNINFTTNNFSMSLWIGNVSITNNPIINTDYYIVNKKFNSENGYAITYKNNGTNQIITAYLNNTNVFFEIPPGHEEYFNPHKWMNIILIKNSNNASLYLNAYLCSEITSDNLLNTFSNNESLVFGSNNTNFPSFNGYLDNIRMFDDEITYPQIIKLYNMELDYYAKDSKKSQYFYFYPMGEPPTVKEGLIYFDNDKHTLRAYNGSNWITYVDTNYIAQYCYPMSNPSNFISSNQVNNNYYLNSNPSNYVNQTNYMMKMTKYIFMEPNVSAPTNPQKGMMYMDTDGYMKVYDGYNWRNLYGLIQ